MAKKWREFEELISRIEGLLAQKGAIIKSPDRIRDKVTGQKREVDASIQIRVGSVDILITVECRDRVAVPDDTWVEQLATKKQKIGATHTIAVSSSGFTKPAIESAELYGIELRVIQDIKDENILAWLNKIKIVNEIGKVSFEGIKIKVYDEDENLALAPEVIASIEKDKLQAEIFYSERVKAKVNIATLLDYLASIYQNTILGSEELPGSGKKILTPGDEFGVSIRPGFMSLFAGAPINAGDIGISKTFKFNLIPGGALIETVKGPKYVKEVEFELVLAVEVQEIPLARRIQYSSTDEPITNVAEADIELFHYDRKKELIISYSTPENDNGPFTVMVSEKTSRNINKKRRRRKKK